MEFIVGKSDLNAIAADVDRTGEPVTVTRDGKPYVDLIPHRNVHRPEGITNAEILAKMREISKDWEPMTRDEIKAAIAEGRR